MASLAAVGKLAERAKKNAEKVSKREQRQQRELLMLDREEDDATLHIHDAHAALEVVRIVDKAPKDRTMSEQDHLRDTLCNVKLFHKLDDAAIDYLSEKGERPLCAHSPPACPPVLRLRRCARRSHGADLQAGRGALLGGRPGR